MNNDKRRLDIANDVPRSLPNLRAVKMNTTEVILFALACTAAAFFTAVIQTGFFFNFRPFGFAPDLCLAVSVACGLKFGPKFGGIVGLLSGFFLDAFSSQGLSLAVIFYMIIGIAMGIIASPRSEISLPHFLLFMAGTAAFALISGLAVLIKMCATISSPLVSNIFLRSTCPELLSTIVFSLPIYPLAALVSNFLKKKQGFYSK